MLALSELSDFDCSISGRAYETRFAAFGLLVLYVYQKEGGDLAVWTDEDRALLPWQCLAGEELAEYYDRLAPLLRALTVDRRNHFAHLTLKVILVYISSCSLH